MAYIKTNEEVERILEGGELMGGILEKLSNMVEPGISAWEVDQEAERLIVAAGGRPAFKGYKSRPKDPPFPSTICASVNNEVVHGIATKDKVLRDGDIFSIDIGMEYPYGKSGKGYYTDTALTVAVGNIPEETQKLMNVTRKSMEAGIAAVKVGGTIASIGKAIEDYINGAGTYGIVRDLVGHGVGHAVHEDPRVPNFYDKDLEKWIIEPGVVIAIEPMVTMGTYEVDMAEDGWSIMTRDKSLSAHFEHTVAVTEDGVHVVTRRPNEMS